MRKTLLTILLFAWGFSAFSQMSGNYNYSVGLRGYSLIQMPKILNEYNSDELAHAPFNSVILKFNDNQISYRLNGAYYNKSKTFFNNCANCEVAKGKLIDYSFKAGFEKNFNYSRIQPYIAIDLGFRANKFTGTMENRNNLKTALAINSPQSSVEASKTGFVMTPTVGLKVNPINEISIFLETNIDILFSYERQEMVTQDAANTRTLNKYNKSEFLLNPFSVGIQIHLSNNK